MITFAERPLFDMHRIARYMTVLLAALLLCFHAYSQEYQPYLSQDDVVNSLQFLPPPPQPGSVAFLADEYAYFEAKKLRGTPRGDQAVIDAVMDDTVLLQFEQSFGLKITQETLPQTYELLMRSKECFGSSGCNKAKEGYQRTRPFVYYGEPTLTPDDEPFLLVNYSYPSGHSANFMGLALILASLHPERQTEIFMRGRDGGYSRAIVGAHWLSDIQAGQNIAALVFARLQSCKEYREQFQKAQKELQPLLYPDCSCDRPRHKNKKTRK